MSEIASFFASGHWELLKDIASWFLVLTGGFFVITGSIGIVRFPDFYTRLHAAGITDTGGAELILLAAAIQAPTWLIFAKISIIGIFLFFTSPVATHAISHAAFVSGLTPKLGRDLVQDDDEMDKFCDRSAP